MMPTDDHSSMPMKQIAHLESLYPTKFGVPRQAGMVPARARVVFEPEYRVAEAVRGLEEFEYVWLLWHFHQADRKGWSPTVRPPRLGGNRRVGVFATRSPYRPNALGLSSVRLLEVVADAQTGPVLLVEGADMVDRTPIFDIKPYIPYADSHPDARAGYATSSPVADLMVEDPDAITAPLPDDVRQALFSTLALDPRPRYQHDSNRLYTMPFADIEVTFRIDGGSVIIVKKR